MKHALIAAALLIVGGTATACGGSDDSSSTASDASSSSSSSSPSAGSSAATDVSGGEFCTALTSGSALNTGADIATLAAKLEKTPTPDGIPDDAKKGFDVYLGVLEGIDPETTADELKAMTDLGLSKAEETEVQSFFTYASTACVPAGAASADPSADASTDPSADASTDSSTDAPTDPAS